MTYQKEVVRRRYQGAFLKEFTMKTYIWLVALSLICGQSFFLFPLVTRATQQPVSTIHPNPVLQKLETYIGDKHIAKAISRVRGTIKINGKEVPKAYLVAAIGKIESDYRPQIVGDGGDSYGLFQIQRKYHGRFADGLESQVDKCESIINSLTVQYGVVRGIQHYNGSGKQARAYAKKILRTMKEVQNA